MSYIGREPQVGNFQVCDAISVVNGQAAYTMQVNSVNVSPETANHMLVSLNGVLQAPGSSYTVSGSTITFASNLVTGDVINFIHILGSVLDLGVPSDNTVSLAKLTATGTKSSSTFLRGDNTFAEAGGGKVLQVQNFQLNAGSSAITTSNSFQDSALTDQITPSATSSKILVMVHLNGFKTDVTSANTIVTVKRAISGGSTTDIGGSGNLRLAHTYEPNAITSAFNVYDSPNTTSAIDYTVQWRTDSTTGYAGQLYRAAATSTITLMEIGA